MSSKTHLGGWETFRSLGKGGQGEVFLARKVRDFTPQPIDQLLDAIRNAAGYGNPDARQRAAHDLVNFVRTIAAEVALQDQAQIGALKLLRPAEDKEASDKAAARMTQEVSALGRLQHPSLVPILEADPSKSWFVMKYFERGTLHGHLGRFRGDVLGALQAFRPLVEAVSELHKNNFVHRDIKPANVFLAGDGSLVLGDFGLVLDVTDGPRVTSTYENVGTRDFMAPWAMGIKIDDVRASFDVFGLGKLLWSMISGRHFLRLWYHRGAEFDIERMTPEIPNARWASRIFDLCIVENEDRCLKNATELLSVVDETIDALHHGAQTLSRDRAHRCRVCGLGAYSPMMFVPPKPREVTFCCNHCGHTQVFTAMDTVPAWKQGSTNVS
jgi:serine/threonine protein kinase